MSRTHIDMTDQAGVVRLTLNRPKAFNALNSALLDELDAVLAELGARDDLRDVLITGG